MIRRFIVTVCMLPALALAAASCSDTEAALDCGSICDRYRDCFDKDYNVESCSDSCKAKAKDDRDYRDKADACHDCIDDRSCGGSFACAPDCLGVVP